MKKIFQTIALAGILLLAGFSKSSATSTANLQVIHNCADPLADTVDVYVNGTLTIPGFAFRTATSFLKVPAGVTLSVAIAPKHSTSVAQALATFPEGPLAADSTYIIVASGIVDTGFANNPNGRNTGFTLKVIAHAETSAAVMGNVDLAIYHGVTDAPSVDVKLSGGGATLAAGLEYLDSTGYLSVPPTWYPVDVLPHGSSTPVASYLADLSSLAGGAGLVLASGFLTPSANHTGPSFGLWLALPSGGNLIQIPLQTNANVQVIHNSPDPAADSVDVYLDGVKAIPNFKFRTATPFIPVLAGVNHKIAVAPANSTSVAQALATFDSINLTANQNYVVTASGVVGSGFASNPNGRSTAFTLLVKASAETKATMPGNFDFFAIHGAPDAPGVNVQVAGGNTIVSNAKYTDQTAYLAVPAGNYVLNVQDSAGSTLVSYSAPLTGLADSSGVILASGFLSPLANNNGPSFGLYLALPAGGALIPLSVYTAIDQVKQQIDLNLFPNPTGGNATVTLELQHPQNVTVELMNINGQILNKINEGELNGRQSINLDFGDYSNGIYLVRISTSNGVSTAKLSVIK